jgi:hypothetical protein
MMAAVVVQRRCQQPQADRQQREPRRQAASKSAQGYSGVDQAGKR